jgi:phosphate transport system permease protein
VLLAVARISGETAPLLFTALNNQFFSADMNAPMANLPVVIYQLRHEPVRRLAIAGLGRRAAGDLQRAGLNILSRTLFSQKIPN